MAEKPGPAAQCGGPFDMYGPVLISLVQQKTFLTGISMTVQKSGVLPDIQTVRSP